MSSFYKVLFKASHFQEDMVDNPQGVTVFKLPHKSAGFCCCFEKVKLSEGVDISHEAREVGSQVTPTGQEGIKTSKMTTGVTCYLRPGILALSGKAIRKSRPASLVLSPVGPGVLRPRRDCPGKSPRAAGFGVATRCCCSVLEGTKPRW